jgi:hypothetical protein
MVVWTLGPLPPLIGGVVLPRVAVAGGGRVLVGGRVPLLRPIVAVAMVLPSSSTSTSSSRRCFRARINLLFIIVTTSSLHYTQRMNIIIPCGGLDERFLREGYVAPKPLIPAMGKPEAPCFGRRIIWILSFKLQTRSTLWVLTFFRPDRGVGAYLAILHVFARQPKHISRPIARLTT